MTTWPSPMNRLLGLSKLNFSASIVAGSPRASAFADAASCPRAARQADSASTRTYASNFPPRLINAAHANTPPRTPARRKPPALKCCHSALAVAGAIKPEGQRRETPNDAGLRALQIHDPENVERDGCRLGIAPAHDPRFDSIPGLLTDLWN